MPRLLAVNIFANILNILYSRIIFLQVSSKNSIFAPILNQNCYIFKKNNEKTLRISPFGRHGANR
jgi:hypothetical protein